MVEQGKQAAKAVIVGASGQVGRQFLEAVGERATATSREGAFVLCRSVESEGGEALFSCAFIQVRMERGRSA